MSENVYSSSSMAYISIIKDNVFFSYESYDYSYLMLFSGFPSIGVPLKSSIFVDFVHEWASHFGVPQDFFRKPLHIPMNRSLFFGGPCCAVTTSGALYTIEHVLNWDISLAAVVPAITTSVVATLAAWRWGKTPFAWKALTASLGTIGNTR